MADVNKPELSPGARPATPPDANGAAPPGGRTPGTAPAPEEAPPHPWHANELVMLLRWLAGMVAVQAFCGWGLFLLVGYALYKFGHPTRGDYTLTGLIVVALSLAIFLTLEHKHLLSRFMGLRLFRHDPYGVKSALYLWLTGMPGLLLRSTSAGEEEAAAAPGHAEPQQADGVREIIETVVFVVVLVLLLRSFAAEAFVIPTGSMAETLYGYQRIVTCPECGVEFPVNCSNEVDPQDGGRASHVFGCQCPNCRKAIHFPAPPQWLDAAHPNPEWMEWKRWYDRWLELHPDSTVLSSAETPDPGWNSGDRVLVAKFLYELFGKPPNRLDVVVFKYPGDSNGPRQFPASGPVKNHSAMNYIKRLVGLPGETIAIYRGRLYYLPPGSGVEFDDEYKEALRDREKYVTLWQLPHTHSGDPKDSGEMRTVMEKFDADQFTIIRPTPETLLAMRRLVYDNDHQAKDLQGVLPPRWAGEGWSEDGTAFKAAAGDDAVRWLRYRHYLRNFRDKADGLTRKAPARSLITDFMGYNFYEPHSGNSPPGENWVGDLMVECEVTVDKADGEVVLELCKSRDRFRLHWNLASGEMDLYRATTRPGRTEEKKLQSARATKPKAGSKYLLRLANFNDRLTVWLDHNLPFGDGVEYPGLKSPEPGAGPVKENDLDPAGVGVKGGAAVTVRKLQLFRNTYYTSGDHPGTTDVAGGRTIDFGNPDDWGDLNGRMPVKFLYVQPNHYLCLGDNSPESSDGRSWGLVPDRLLLGRAMLVYYPFGRTGRIR
jgi:signal peptidase I